MLTSTWRSAVFLWVCIAGLGATRAADSAESVTYYYTDQQGTVLSTANASGSVTSSSDYRPHGLQALGTPEDGPGYTGHVGDIDSSLIYMQARYYDPAIGVFLSTDPVAVTPGNVFSFMRYVYGDDNPIVKTDPTGKATCANPPSCTLSRIDAHPAGATGPTITFTNDDPHGASPNQPISTATAVMVESAVIRSGATSVNINSTNGGTHAPNSRHAQNKAVDIDAVNGQTVRSQGASQAVTAVQDAFRAEPNARENFGPSRMEKTNAPGGQPQPFDNPQTAEDHQGHLHESGQD